MNLLEFLKKRYPNKKISELINTNLLDLPTFNVHIAMDDKKRILAWDSETINRQ